MSDNTLYSALSTIAQSVAALIAFLGAFVLFRFQSSDQYLKDLSTSLAEATTREGKQSELQLQIAARRYTTALASLKHASALPGAIAQNYQALELELMQLDKIRIRFNQLLWPSAFVIASAVVAIFLVDQYKGLAPASFAVVGTLVFLFLMVLIRMVQIMRLCLGTS